MADENSGLFDSNIPGRFKFFKRLMRRLVAWYVEPIAQRLADQQKKQVTHIEESLARRIHDIEVRGDQNDEKLASVIRDVQQWHTEIQAEVASILNQYTHIRDSVVLSQNRLDHLFSQGVDLGDAQTFNILNKKTYSQAGEDSELAYLFGVLGYGLKDCTYLDLGANHPKEMSNTYMLYEQGARGVLVEANPQLIPELKLYRSDDVILNCLVSNEASEGEEFVVMNVDGLSTMTEQAAHELTKINPDIQILKKVRVPAITVSEIFAKYFDDRAPLVLSIDIEGHELTILHSIDFVKYRPIAVLIEMIPYSTGLVIDEKDENILSFMDEHGYAEFAFTGINSIFVDRHVVNHVNDMRNRNEAPR